MNLNSAIGMQSELKERAFECGQNCGILEQFGASPEQIQNYINFQLNQIPLPYRDDFKYRSIFLLHVELGGQQYRAVMDNPVFRERVNDLHLMVKQNWECLQS